MCLPAQLTFEFEWRWPGGRRPELLAKAHRFFARRERRRRRPKPEQLDLPTPPPKASSIYMAREREILTSAQRGEQWALSEVWTRWGDVIEQCLGSIVTYSGHDRDDLRLHGHSAFVAAIKGYKARRGDFRGYAYVSVSRAIGRAAKRRKAEMARVRVQELEDVRTVQSHEESSIAILDLASRIQDLMAGMSSKERDDVFARLTEGEYDGPIEGSGLSTTDVKEAVRRIREQLQVES